jgi:hypothetical protein
MGGQPPTGPGNVGGPPGSGERYGGPPHYADRPTGSRRAWQHRDSAGASPSGYPPMPRPGRRPTGTVPWREVPSSGLDGPFGSTRPRGGWIPARWTSQSAVDVLAAMIDAFRDGFNEPRKRR